MKKREEPIKSKLRFLERETEFKYKFKTKNPSVKENFTVFVTD